jgi:hypothetical protein
MFSLFLFIGLTVAAHLFKLWAAQISPHSTVIFGRPLNKKRWNCWLCLICPNTGSFSIRRRSFFRGQPFPNFLPLLFFQRNVDGFCVFVFGACRLKRASGTCRTTIRPFDGDVPVVGRFVPFIHKPQPFPFGANPLIQFLIIRHVLDSADLFRLRFRLF